jgi:hypothetical protein
VIIPDFTRTYPMFDGSSVYTSFFIVSWRELARELETMSIAMDLFSSSRVSTSQRKRVYIDVAGELFCQDAQVE